MSGEERERKALSLAREKRGREAFPAASLDIFWLRDEGFEDSDNLPNADVLAQEIVVPRLASLRTTSKPPSNSSAKSPAT